MLADTYSLGGLTFTKRSTSPVTGAVYTDGLDILSRTTLTIRYQTDKKGVVRTLIDISTNVPDAAGSKVDHVRRSYHNIVRYPTDLDTDVVADFAFFTSIFAHATLPGLIVDQTA
jgi:hypothetical protein